MRNLHETQSLKNIDKASYYAYFLKQECVWNILEEVNKNKENVKNLLLNRLSFITIRLFTKLITEKVTWGWRNGVLVIFWGNI